MVVREQVGGCGNGAAQNRGNPTDFCAGFRLIVPRRVRPVKEESRKVDPFPERLVVFRAIEGLVNVAGMLDPRDGLV
jgi:hypothetical protein